MTKSKRPLVVVVDPAGGEDPSRIARRLTDALSRSGVRPDRIGVWPTTDHLDLWSMPTEEMVAVLERLINSGTSTRGGDR